MLWLDASYLWLLLLIPAFAGGYWWVRNYFKKKREAYFDDKLIQQLRRGFWQLGENLRLITILLALMFFIIGLAGPKIGTEVREIERKGVDLLIALDLSRSMNAEDVRPSRLAKAKFEISRLIDRAQGDRIGLLVFTGEAFVQSPMTLDYSALRMFLDIAETHQMPSGTTNFRNAMLKAAETFQALDEQSSAAKAMVFISDGENHGPAYNEALTQLVGIGVTIFTVGVGTPEGGPIPNYVRGTNNLIGYQRDAQGAIVTTRLETETLQDIARRGNGSYLDIRSGAATIDPLLARLDELEKGEFSSQEFADYKNRYQILLILGLACFITGIIIPEYRKTNGWQ